MERFKTLLFLAVVCAYAKSIYILLLNCSWLRGWFPWESKAWIFHKLGAEKFTTLSYFCPQICPL